MTSRNGLLLLASLVPLAGCANPDSVLFVTDTSLGIDVDSKPSTVSLAYDRIEGFLGPRYPNGAVPPVVGAIETGGTMFDPKVRQIYATGAAAVKAAGTPNAPEGPKDLVGTQKRMVFFGTTTTLGLKASFDATGTPDGLSFGYKRKEMSFIPLGSQTVNGVTTDVYPSVLATIDTDTKVASSMNAGLTSRQFFATGQAAETLAGDPAIVAAFNRVSEDSVTASLTQQQRQQAQDAGAAAHLTQTARVARIMAAVAPGGALDPQKLKALVAKANAAASGAVPASVGTVPSAATLQAMLQANMPIAASLSGALDQPT